MNNLPKVLTREMRVKQQSSNEAKKESVYQFFKKHHGEVNAILYRILMIIGATTRLLILLPLVFFRKILPIAYGVNYYHSIFKYTKVISWGLGFEKWTKNPG